jgi:hypothetical protein
MAPNTASISGINSTASGQLAPPNQADAGILTGSAPKSPEQAAHDALFSELADDDWNSLRPGWGPDRFDA